MFFNLLAQRARDDINDALRVRQLGQQPPAFAVKPQGMPPQQPQGALPQATMPQPGMPQAQMNAGFPQAPVLPQQPQMPAMSGLGAPYGMQSAMPMAPRPMSAQGPMRFASGGLVHMFRVK